MERCECQSRTLLSTEDELKRKTEDCKQLEERLLRLERDVRQKRTFIDSLKEKDIKQQSLLDECQGKIVSVKLHVLVLHMYSFCTSVNSSLFECTTFVYT